MEITVIQVKLHEAIEIMEREHSAVTWFNGRRITHIDHKDSTEDLPFLRCWNSRGSLCLIEIDDFVEIAGVNVAAHLAQLHSEHEAALIAAASEDLMRYAQ
jgi:hypothetical protein